MNETNGLSANTTAILLLTAPLVVSNRGPRAQVLTAGEYRKLRPCLASVQSEPADLLEPGADRLLAHCGAVVDEIRLRSLLKQRIPAEPGGGALAHTRDLVAALR